MILNTHAWYYKPLLVSLKPLCNKYIWCIVITPARVGTNTTQYVEVVFINPFR